MKAHIFFRGIAAAALLGAMPAIAQAQDAAAAKPEPSMINETTTVLLVVATLLAMLTIAVIIAAVQVIMLMNKIMNPEQATAKREDRVSFWEKIAGLSAKSKEKDLLLHEDYDGIQELDNPVPAWFNALFYGTILIGVVYLFHYHYFETGELQEAEYQSEMAAAEVAKAEYMKLAANSIDESNAKQSQDPADLNAGKEIFLANCVACHGQAAEGKNGPNLTDAYWIHGGTIGSVFKTIKYGVTEKGMIAWQTKLNPMQIQQVASYILSLQGSNPAGAKAPEGNLEQGGGNTAPAASGDSTAAPAASGNAQAAAAPTAH